MTEDLFAPTPPKRRETNVVAFRMNPKGVEWLDKIADEVGVTRTEVMKAALTMVVGKEKDLKKVIKERQQP